MRKKVPFPYLGNEEDYLMYNISALAKGEERDKRGLMAVYYNGGFDVRFLRAYLAPGLEASRKEQGKYNKATFYADIEAELDEMGHDLGGMLSAIIEAMLESGIFKNPGSESKNKNPIKAAK